MQIRIFLIIYSINYQLFIVLFLIFVFSLDFLQLISNITAEWEPRLWPRRRWSHFRGLMASLAISVWVCASISWITWFSANYRQESNRSEICTTGKITWTLFTYFYCLHICFINWLIDFYLNINFLFKSYWNYLIAKTLENEIS